MPPGCSVLAVQAFTRGMTDPSPRVVVVVDEGGEGGVQVGLLPLHDLVFWNCAAQEPGKSVASVNDILVEEGGGDTTLHLGTAGVHDWQDITQACVALPDWPRDASGAALSAGLQVAVNPPRGLAILSVPHGDSEDGASSVWVLDMPAASAPGDESDEEGEEGEEEEEESGGDESEDVEL